jgi:Fe-S cluster assembly ATPase SufC
MKIKTPSWRQKVGNLSAATSRRSSSASGCHAPEVLIVDEPTRGIDVGSKAEIHNLIRDLAAAGLRRHRDLLGDARGPACLRPHRGDVSRRIDARVHRPRLPRTA